MSQHLPAFIEGDTPLTVFEYDLPASFESMTAATLSVAGQSIPAEVQDDYAPTVVGSLASLTLPVAGLYPVYVVAAAGARSQRVLVDWLAVVDPADQWHNVLSARDAWGSGAPDDSGDLYRLLEVARDQVEAYAPAVAEGARIPERYRVAQLMQARAVLNAYVSNGDQQTDLGGGIIVNVRPLDWNVKQLLRPKRGLKAVG